MRRLPSVFLLIVPFLLFMLALAPVAAAADPTTANDGVLMAFDEDVTLPADQSTDLVLVIGGTATIQGEADAIVAIGGAAELDGATVDTVVAIGSPVQVGAGSTVTGDIATFDSAAVEVASGAVVNGAVRDLTPQLVGAGAILGPALVLVFIGFMLVTFVAGLALAALASRQVRAAESLISHEPGTVLVAGLAGIVLPLLLIGALLVSVVGIPLGLALLLSVWPAVAYLGYLVAAIWIGDWILGRTSPERVRERPYLASVIGILVLMVLAIIPLAGAIASLFGYGAVLLLAWRVFRGSTSAAAPTVSGITPAPMPS
jgi:hypothetical protein